MRLRQALPAGLVDAGVASLATFGIGVYAARSLPASELGAYALFFSAFVLATTIPSQLVLVPASFATVASAEGIERLAFSQQLVRLGGPPGALAAFVACAAASVTAEASSRVLGALAVTTFVCSIVSPLQDHVRGAFHIAGLSWFAAVVSLVQLVGVVGALALFEVAGVEAIWRPVGALALANIVSLGTGVTLARWQLGQAMLPRFELRPLLRRGRWMVAQEAAIAGAYFVASAAVSRLASPEALGLSEIARLVAQPLFVFRAGLSSVLWPRSLEAGAARSREAAQRAARPFFTLFGATGVLYGLVTSAAWDLNPFATLMPQAYTSAGLVPITVAAYLLQGLTFPARAEVLGAGREQALLWVAMGAGIVQCGTALSAAWIGAFARPVSMAVFAAVFLLGCEQHRRGIYYRE